MDYLKKEKIDDHNDISLVNHEIEVKPQFTLSLEMLSDSIFYIYPSLVLVLTESLNLIFLGHIIDDVDGYNKLNFFQLGFTFLNLFGFAFSLGVTKIIKKGANLTKFFHNTKLIILFITLMVILPLMIASYFILDSLFSSAENQAENSNIWKIYTQFLLLSPIFSLFHLLLQTNLRALQVLNDRLNLFWLFILNISLHLIFLYAFLFYFNYGILGVTLSMILSSLFTYIYSNYVLNNILEFQFVQSYPIIHYNFYFIPDFSIFHLNDFYSDFKYVSRNSFVAGVVYFAEYSGYGFFLLLSYFISEKALTTNIILMNLFSFLHSIGHGFSYTLRHYIRLSMSNYKHSHIGKKKFAKLISILVFIVALFLALVILFLDGSIVRFYISPIEGSLISEDYVNIVPIFSQISNFYALIIFFDYFSRLFDGYIKGIDAKNTHLLIYKISFVLIFVPAGLVLCFVFDLGLIGFWLSIYAYLIIYALINAFYVYKNYSNSFH